jgi:preprotein translocase subunit YajC
MRKLKIGDRVCIEDEGTEGKIIDIDDEMVTVDLGKHDGCWVFRRDDLRISSPVPSASVVCRSRL